MPNWWNPLSYPGLPGYGNLMASGAGMTPAANQAISNVSAYVGAPTPAAPMGGPPMGGAPPPMMPGLLAGRGYPGLPAAEIGRQMPPGVQRGGQFNSLFFDANGRQLADNASFSGSGAGVGSM
jgi:hypothetical protein